MAPARMDATNTLPPKLIRQVEPLFREAVRSEKVSGTVTLKFFATTSGTVADISVAKSVGFGLDEDAVTALRQYRFAPAQYMGRDVGAELSSEINFQIF